MPKDTKKRSRKESDSSSDSGPDDPTPVKKSSKGGSSSGGSRGDKPCAIPGDTSGEPSWGLGNMKFVKVHNATNTALLVRRNR